MKILGIETSCDETAASVVEDGNRILSNIVLSSLKDHQKFGGVIPEIASRRQLEYIQDVVNQALSEAKITLDQIDAIAVTKSPGLIGSLLVGNAFAQALSLSTDKPLINVDHIHAHLYANYLNKDTAPQLPAIGLVVSGGHTNLYYLKNFQDLQLLGNTLDDAVGEAYDKVARVLDLGYPGGPVIDRLAATAKTKNVAFKSAKLPESYNFSYSGMKTAVLYHHRDHHQDPNYNIAEVAFGFQNGAIRILIEKCKKALKEYKVSTLLIGGGVAANSFLRELLDNLAKESACQIYYPPMPLCMDNAAMIAGLGYQLHKKTKETHG